MQAKIETWDQARELALKEIEKKVGKIEKYWPDSISLEPKYHGGLWNIRLDVQVKAGLFKKKLLKVMVKADPITGEIREFKVRDA